MKRTTIILVIAAILTISARGQGFLNLNFESAYNLPGNPGNHGSSVSVTNALPDWTAYGGALPLSYVYYVSNNFPGASTVVELESGSLALSGNFSVGLYPGSLISQTGLVPGNAESLEFEAYNIDNALLVTLGGQSLLYSEISQDSGYNVYGANIPADMDGQTETLTFGVESPADVLLDNIEFLTTSVPEPSEYVLIGVGGILLGIRYWRKLRK